MCNQKKKKKRCIKEKKYIKMQPSKWVLLGPSHCCVKNAELPQKGTF